MNTLKTILPLLCLVFSQVCQGQTIHEVEKSKMRIRITLICFTADGSFCQGAVLVKNKLGREEASKAGAADPFGGGKRDPFARSIRSRINVIDLAGLSIKPGESCDLTLYSAGIGVPPSFAINASNALLAQQGKFKVTLTPALMERMSFLATLSKDAEGNIRMVSADPRFQMGEADDPFASSNKPIILIGTPTALNVKLYPTARDGAFALTAKDAWETWQTR